MAGLGLAVHSVPLCELFGKAGGVPACAALYLPDIPERLIVDRGYFEGRARG